MPALALQGILLVYDITNRWSFDGIDRWIKEIDEVGALPQTPFLATPIPDTWADIPHLQREPLGPPLAVPPTPRFCGSPSAGCYGTVGWGSGPPGAPPQHGIDGGPAHGLGAGAWGWMQRGILPLRLC